jgi:hypothetical protein
LLIKLMAELDVAAMTPTVHRLLSAWLSNPIVNSQRVGRATVWVGRLINPPGGAAPDHQDRGFALLYQAASAVSQAWQNIASSDTSDERVPGQRAETAIAIEVAEGIAKQIYFASGAMQQAGSDQPSRGDAHPFATHSLPVLDELATIPHPRVTHYIIKTLNYLLRCNIEPYRCYLVAASAVQPDSGYEYELLAVQEVMQLVDHFVADHRDMLLDDPDCLSATRRLLGVFIRAGWDAAIQRALELDEAFR